VRDEMLHLGCWQIGPALPPGAEYDFDVIARFASGDLADNKIVADLPLLSYDEYCQEVPDGRRLSADDLEAVRENILGVYNTLADWRNRQPDTMWGVPNGGQSYGRERAKRLGLAFVELVKVETLPGKKTFRPASGRDAELIEEARVMVGSEDAGNDGTSPYGAMYESDKYGLAPLREKTVGLDFIWIRGGLKCLRGLGLGINTIVYQPVPNRIRRSDPFYQQFGRLAVPSLALV